MEFLQLVNILTNLKFKYNVIKVMKNRKSMEVSEEQLKTTYKFGVRLLKNRLHPVKMPKNYEGEVEHGMMILVATEKGRKQPKY